MTPDQIKQLAKQAGGDYDTDDNDPMALVMFYKNELAEFVRLVRDDALEEAARQFDPGNGAWPVMEIINTIKRLK